MSDKWHGGKGDKSRVSDYKKYASNWDQVFAKRTWKYWAKYEGLDYENMVFDKYMLDEDEKMSYTEFRQRLNKNYE
jgi:hypothetical protein